MSMKKWFLTTAGVLLACGTTMAQTHNETGDAGETVAGAQFCYGAGALTTINGALHSGTADTDIFHIQIDDIATFRVDVSPTATASGFDSQLYLFKPDGTPVMFDDDNPTDYTAYLDNSGGQLTIGGEYLLAITSYNRKPYDAANVVLFANAPFYPPQSPVAFTPVDHWTGGSSTARAYTMTLTGCSFIVPLVHTPPTASLQATPAVFEQTRTVKLTAAVTPGITPPSANITVQADLTALGGTASEVFDDLGPGGGHGDAVAGDLIYTRDFTVTGAAPLGPGTLTFTIADDYPSSSSPTMAVNVTTRSWNESADGGGDAGDLPGTAQTITGSGAVDAITGTIGAADADMYKFTMCDPSSFSATTVGGATYDTMLWLFNADGTGVIADDDEGTLQSTLPAGNALITALTPGTYYLAICQYYREPVGTPGGVDYLWDLGFNLTAPTLPSTPIGGWAGTGGGGGDYRIALTGACVYDPTAPTPPTGVPAASFTPPLTSGTSVLLTVATTPGTFPTSINIAVTADMAIFGGTDGSTMFDDGPGGGHGDAVAGDGTFSLTFTVPPAQPGGPTVVHFHVSDSNSARTTSPQITLTVINPPAATDLGTIVGPSDTVTLTSIDTGTQVKWFKFTIGSDCDDTTTYYLDIDTTSDGITDPLDTEIGTYRTDGTLIASDDDDGSPVGVGYSALSHGATTPARDYSAIGAGGHVNGDGRDGVLTAGTYYLAVGCWNTTFNATAFNVTSTSTITGGFKLNLRTNLPGGPVACSPADLVDGLGVPPGDGFVTGTDADFFVQAYNTLSQRPNGSYYADLTDGFGGGPDGFVTGTDADYFTEKYFLGC